MRDKKTSIDLAITLLSSQISRRNTCITASYVVCARGLYKSIACTAHGATIIVLMERIRSAGGSDSLYLRVFFVDYSLTCTELSGGVIFLFNVDVIC